ncbi:MAG: molybdopterin-dependent oxidoreductase [Actinomycetota bacterium]|nr:molybdopterin-dependent oxidoreductase [Actinomycetota bacterium]
MWRRRSSRLIACCRSESLRAPPRRAKSHALEAVAGPATTSLGAARLLGGGVYPTTREGHGNSTVNEPEGPAKLFSRVCRQSHVSALLDGKPLSSAHGKPLRLVAPAHYAYKSVKGLATIEMRTARCPGGRCDSGSVIARSSR